MPSFDPGTESAQRDDAWLTERVSLIRQVHFADVPQGYPIVSRFGIRARNRFGSIGARAGQSIILINRLFADPFVPDFVVDGTLAHELAHYAHGYGSGLPLLHKDPHRGGVVDQELERRGLGDVNRNAEAWRRRYWDAYYQTRCSDLDGRRTARQASIAACWLALLSRPGHRTQAELDSQLARLSPEFGHADPPFEVEWLHATLRQTAPSYWFSRSCVVRIHGLAADPRVPAALIEAELAYWLARRAVGDNTDRIQRALERAGLERSVQEAMSWRRHAWTAFCGRHHPLRA
ncbi:MAG TPA: hypothetical protein VKT77_13000 [Chthonomonadaceae bacterium]|nr:hypothetical protein [Chthonomonadaceae bacterium]